MLGEGLGELKNGLFVKINYGRCELSANLTDLTPAV